jgi:hypothetical protein
LPNRFKAQIAQYRPQIRQSVESGVLLSYVYTYRNTDPALLAKYETFLLEPASRKFHKLAFGGMGDSFGQAITNWFKDFSTRLKKQAAQ